MSALDGENFREISSIVEDFKFIANWEEKYTYIIDLGRTLDPLSKEEMCEQNKVSGCISQVWLVSQILDEKRIKFRATSDSMIVRGLIAIIFAIYSGKEAELILATDPGPTFSALGLKGHLSPSRANGFFAMVNSIKKVANQSICNKKGDFSI